MLYTIGIVGTSGKSTTTWLTRHLLKSAGLRVGIMSSVGNFYREDVRQSIPHRLRFAGAPYLEYTLAEIERAGCTHAVIELSVNEARVGNLPNVNYAAAVWTTLHPDDMDYTGDTEANFRDKWRVMQGAPCKIINLCDAWGKQFAADACITYADGAAADWQAGGVIETASGSSFTVHMPGSTFQTGLPLIGRHNVSNALGALAAAHHAGVSITSLAEHLQTFEGIPGRMQLIAANPIRVLVDFANTPSRLKRSLESLRATTARELVLVTGSPDDTRYVPDRAALGEAATRFADRVIFTEAGYSNESPDDILSQVTLGAVRDNFEIVPDRTAAIQHALSAAQAGDTVLVAGKGTEETIARGEQGIAWDEASVVKELWERHKANGDIEKKNRGKTKPVF